MAGIAAIVLWSSTIGVTRSLSERVGPLAAGAAVYLIAGGLSLVMAWWNRSSAQPTAPTSSRYLWGCGFLFVLYTILLYLALGLAGSREQVLGVGMVNYLWPALTLLLSIPLLHQRAGAWLWPGTLLATAGVGLVMTPGDRWSWSSLRAEWKDATLPYLLAAAAALTWALYSNLARRWSTPGSRGAVEVFLAATGLVLLLGRWRISEVTNWTAAAMGEALFLGSMTAIAYGFWDHAMRRGNLTLVGACSYATPLLSTALSCVYLGVPFTSRLWIGCGLVVAGSVLSWRSLSPAA